jgi:hypothetical protein
MKTHRRFIFFVLLGMALLAVPARAADHGDGTASGIALALEPAADVNDVFAWMSADASRVYLAMSVFPGASANSRFSDAVKYVFHTSSVATYLGASAPRDVICTFSNATPQVASCWVTDPANASVKAYVTGNAGAVGGITSGDARLRLFAGLRDDPFFFNLAGFRNAASTVGAALKEAGPTLMGTYIKGLDPTHPGCPILSAAGRTTVVGYISHDCTGAGPAVDFFKKPAGTENASCTTKPALVSTMSNNTGLTGSVLAIVLSVDKTLLTAGGAVLAVWGATTK